jgi:PKD repeat protein
MGSGSAFVAPFQGFMVHKTTVGGTASFDLGRTECTNTTTTFFKTYASTDGTLTMKVNGNGFNDISTILFNTNATDHFDPQFDANKLPGKLTQPMIASKLGADLYSINNISSVANVPAVPVQFMPGTNGTYTITFDDIATFDPTVNIYLEDVKTGSAWQDLRKNNVYSFSSATTDIKDRFIVHFTLPATVETFDASCKTTGSMIVKQDGTPTWDVVVKDVNGQVKGQGSISQSNNLQLNNLEAGDYTVEFADANGHSAIKNVKVDGVNGVSVSYIANNITPYTNETVTFTSTANSAVTYAWDFGDGTTSTLANPTHVYTATGTYSVTLKATNVDGCDATIAQSITVSQDVTGINNPKSTNNGIVIYVNNGKNLNITFSGYHGEIADIQAFNLLGQEIVNVKHNTGTKFVQEIDQVEAAYVIVKVTVSGQATTKKVLITKE